MEGWRARLVLRVVTPVHVGSGVVIRNPNLEYNVNDDYIYRLDVNRFIEDQSIPIHEKNIYLSGKVSAQIKDKLYPRYSLVQRSGTYLGPEVREAIKLQGDRPYLPGSTVKGAMRTAIAWHLFKQMTGEDPERLKVIIKAGIESNDKLKAQSLENLLFRQQLGDNPGDPDAKSDVLKGLIVRDSDPIRLIEYRRYQVVLLHRDGLDRKLKDPPAVEAIVAKQEIPLEVIMRTDQLNSDGNYRPNLEAAKVVSDFNQFKSVIEDYGNSLVEKEIEYFKKAGLDEAVSWISNKNLIPLGFGTGWNAHTVGLLLTQNEISQASISFSRGKPPPISRRLTLDKSGNLKAPLGWVEPRWEKI
jgi:CRISPR-associated protein Csm5